MSSCARESMSVAHTSASLGRRWLAEEERPLLMDIWELCEARREPLAALVRRTFSQFRALAAPASAALPLPMDEAIAALRAAAQGELGPLLTAVERGGRELAEAAAAADDVCAMVEGARREVALWIIERHAGDGPRLERTLSLLHRLSDAVVCTVWEAYLSHRDQRLREQQRSADRAQLWMKRLFESGLLGILICDVHGGIKEANETFAQMVGYSREELTSGVVKWSEMTPPEWAVLDADAVSQLAQTGRTRPWEKEYFRKDGSRVPILVGVASLVGDEVVAFTLDISERKRAEELRIRSIALEGENRRIQEASRLKSEFLANMSHELRTPLNSIIGFADLLYDEEIAPDSPQHREFLGDILKSGRHLLQLINDVLDLAKIEAGKMEFRPERFDVARLFGEVIDVLRALAGANRISIECKVEPEVRELVLDPGRLKQVLYNYLSNALKFTSPGGRVNVRARAAGDAQVLIEVEDTGQGIAREDQARLFVAFEQLDHGISKRHAGTGLGLALTRRIVEEQGGAVGVQSELHRGSTFWARLPREAHTLAEPAPARLPERYDDAALVLVVEDEPADQQLLARTLNGAGYGVELASSGRQAAEACRERVFDAITLDLLLPDQSGLEVLRELRRAGLNRLTPVIVVSVVAEHQVVEGFSVHDYLPKPIEGGKLIDSLERAGIAPTKSESILVVDDDPSSLKLMRTTLQRLGYMVDCQSDPVRALEIARSHRHGAVILDLLMPGMDGFEFLRRFRDDSACRQTPVIVWTTKDLNAEDQRRLQHAAQAVFEKGSGRPLPLVDELRLLLGERAAHPES